jgi:hypothetical protein
LNLYFAAGAGAGAFAGADAGVAPVEKIFNAFWTVNVKPQIAGTSTISHAIATSAGDDFFTVVSAISKTPQTLTCQKPGARNRVPETGCPTSRF